MGLGFEQGAMEVSFHSSLPDVPGSQENFGFMVEVRYCLITYLPYFSANNISHYGLNFKIIA